MVLCVVEVALVDVTGTGGSVLFKPRLLIHHRYVQIHVQELPGSAGLFEFVVPVAFVAFVCSITRSGPLSLIQW